MANPNGIGAQNAAMYSGMNGSIMPSAGHYSDMQTLMQNMENLSGWLEQNRQEWSQVQEGIARVERLQSRLASNGQLPQMNGDAQSPIEESNSPTISQLQSALSQTTAKLTSLERLYNDHLRLQALYEETLTDTTERIRQYCFEQQTHILALHEHYTTLLFQARSELVEAQLTHQGWQAGLQRVSEGVRKAMKEREEEVEPWRKKVAALREENRVLRAKVGWQPVKETEDEEDGFAIDERRGRAE